ncbi:zinc finger, CCHC-type containing protein [Tanacetum coccineum]
MHFLLSTMNVVYVLTTPIPEYGENDTLEEIRKRSKWENDDYDFLDVKYMVEDASSKKFLVCNFTNYKMTDSRTIMEQYNELLGILGRFTQHKMNMDEAIQVSCIIDKLPPYWKYFKHTLKHKKEELTLVELDTHLRIEESLKVQDSDKLKGNTVFGPSVVNTIEHNKSITYNENKGKHKHHDNIRTDLNKKAKPTCWKCGKTGHIKKECKGVNVGSRTNYSGTSGLDNGLVPLKVVRLPDPKLKTLDKRCIECIFVGYAEHSKAFRFYVIEPNELDSINSIIESMDAIFDEKKLSSVPRPMARISTIRLLIALASIHNLIIHQMDVKITFLNGDLEEEVYMNKPQAFIMPGNKNKVCKLIKSIYGLKQAPNKFDESDKGVIICLYVDDMLIFGTNQVQVDLTKKFLSSSPLSTLMDTSEKLMSNNGQAVSQLEYSRVIYCLMYAMTYTRPDISFAMGKLKGYTNASWFSNTKDNSSTSGWDVLVPAEKEDEVFTSMVNIFEKVLSRSMNKEEPPM